MKMKRRKLRSVGIERLSEVQDDEEEGRRICTMQPREGELLRLECRCKEHDIEAKDSRNRWRAVHYAAWQGREEVVKTVVAAGANVDASEFPEWRAVRSAAGIDQTLWR